MYNSSREKLIKNVSATVEFYNDVLRAADQRGNRDLLDSERDPSRISWSAGLASRMRRGQDLAFVPKAVRIGQYRPFEKQNLYFSPDLNERLGAMPTIFPASPASNFGISLTGVSSHYAFTVYMAKTTPNLHLLDSAQFFPRYVYANAISSESNLLDGLEEASGQRIDNVTDAALVGFRSAYGEDVTKDDIFYYLYGVLHSREYRERFAADLKKMLPRIPQVQGLDKFQAFVDAGKRLSDLHIGYESLEPFAIQEVSTGLAMEQDEYARYAVKKMKYAGKAGSWDKTRVVYNSHITLEGIPDEAQRYMLGSRSALDWIIERYQVKTDKTSGIVNDPNDWSREHEQPRYIIDLIGRIVALSLETNRIVDALPELGLP
ncbi:type ISP restriction/modification enzyme [Arthrobacter sp. NPDC093125]|uniref:type ISP restriction/modification enzyme n=1 Tax=Arthrobacter sp. NPDC093125 TaxID=3363944 RepID=UPI003824BA59